MQISSSGQKRGAEGGLRGEIPPPTINGLITPIGQKQVNWESKEGKDTLSWFWYGFFIIFMLVVVTLKTVTLVTVMLMTVLLVTVSLVTGSLVVCS